MKSPSVEDFGLLESDLAEVEKLRSTLGRQTRSVMLVILSSLGLGLVVSGRSDVMWYLLLTPFGWIPSLLIYHWTLKLWESRYPKIKQVSLYRAALQQYKEWWRKTQRTFWLSLSGRNFEFELASLFRRCGYTVQVTKGSGDKGVDIWITTRSGMIAVQCKAHKAPVGVAIVRELYGAMLDTGASDGILASLSGATPGVFQFVRGKPIKVLVLNDIIFLQENLEKGVTYLSAYVQHLTGGATPTGNISP
jgi:hypothetical protein